MTSATPASLPLCSIGIPTYNRPDLLAETIDDACAQSYPNLEIIVSDNASTDPRVEQICRERAARDPRIRYIRQPANLGPMPNFEATLVAATGAYFCWFADDDRHTAHFVRRLVDLFAATSERTALVCTEAQYESPDGPFPFFPEATRFYQQRQLTPPERVGHALRHAPGNIIYGLFRREFLFHDGVPLTRWIGPSLNELPFFALIASKGDIVCGPEIGFIKRAPLHVCRAARWEQEGGVSPLGPQANVPGVLRYHWKVYRELVAAFEAMALTPADRRRLERDARASLLRHALQFSAGWKPRVRA